MLALWGAGSVVLRLLGKWRNLVSGIRAKKCHNQSRAICADIKEVKTTNSKVLAKHENESILFLYENTRPHSSLRTREAVTKIEWNALPNPPYSSDITAAAFLSLATRGTHPEVAVLWMTSCKTACVSSAPKLQQTLLHDSHTASHANVEKCVGNVGDFVEKWSQLCKGSTHDICKFHLILIIVVKKIGGVTSREGIRIRQSQNFILWLFIHFQVSIKSIYTNLFTYQNETYSY
jgi:hypothetical protein